MSGLTIGMLSAVLFFLQGSVLPFLFGGSSQPDLWLVTIALASLTVDRRSAWTLAVVGGFLQDILTANLFGLHLLPYLIITLLFTKFGRRRYNRHWYISCLAALFATLDYMILSAIVMWWAVGHHPALSYLFSMGLPLMGWNVLAAIVMHQVVWRLRQVGEVAW